MLRIHHRQFFEVLVLNIVVSAAFGYQSVVLYPFIRSLRKVHKDRVAFLIRPNQVGEMEGFAKEHGVELVVCEHSWHAAPEINRYFAALDFLRRTQDVDGVFLTDSRDVIFQGSPFLSGDYLYLYTEPVKIRECPFNGNWIRHYYGDVVYEQIADNPVLCSGTTLGSYGRVLEYLEIMCAEMKEKLSQNYAYLVGADQGIHFYKFYTGGIPGAVVREHGYSEVQTLHYEKKFLFSKDGFLLNVDGSVVPVVHQYDRHSQFWPLFERMINR